MSDETITVRFLNHFGGGFAENIEVVKGTTLGQFVTSQLSKRGDEGQNSEDDENGETTLKSVDPGDYKIRHNRAPGVDNDVLQNQDLVVLVPMKQAGA